jgi:DedD protein
MTAASPNLILPTVPGNWHRRQKRHGNRRLPAPPAPGETRSERPEQPVLDAQGVPVAWMLQVASVSSAERAEELRQRLEARGEKAWIAQATINNRTTYRVNVGPKFERARLEALRPQIDAEFGVTSLVKRYVP